ncbi:MAG: hypothetical protein ACLQA5_22405 [Solirubrobacteraceae bacterium]
MAQQTAATAGGLDLGSDDGLDGTIGFDGERSPDLPSRRDRNATNAGVTLVPRMRPQRCLPIA